MNTDNQMTLDIWHKTELDIDCVREKSNPHLRQCTIEMLNLNGFEQKCS